MKYNIQCDFVFTVSTVLFLGINWLCIYCICIKLFLTDSIPKLLPFSVFTTCLVCAQTPETGKSESARVRKFVSAPRNKKQTEDTTKVTPNKPPPKINVISKTVLQITLAAKWLVKLSITSPKQQRRPMPSLMSVSSTVCIAQCSAPRNKKLFENHRYCSDILTDSALYIMSDSTFSCLTWHTHVWLGALMSDLAL